MKDDPRYHDGTAMLGLMLTIILTALAVWGVLWAQKAFAEPYGPIPTCDGKEPFNGAVPVYFSDDNCMVWVSKKEAKRHTQELAALDAMNWVEAIKTADKAWKAEIAESRKREDLLLGQVKLLNYQIDTLSKAVLDNGKE